MLLLLLRRVAAACAGACAWGKLAGAGAAPAVAPAAPATAPAAAAAKRRPGQRNRQLRIARGQFANGSGQGVARHSAIS